MERLRSRKLWVAVIAGAIVAFAKQFGVELDMTQLISIGAIAATYIGGQAVVDRGKVVAEVQGKIPQLVASLNQIAKSLDEDKS